MKRLTIVFTACLILLLSGCGQTIGDDVRLYNPELNRDCPRCDLRGADLSDVYSLAGADLRGADLRGAKLMDIYWSGADLTGADLTGADLTRGWLDEVDLSHANLTNSKLKESILLGLIFRKLI